MPRARRVKRGDSGCNEPMSNPRGGSVFKLAQTDAVSVPLVLTTLSPRRRSEARKLLSAPARATTPLSVSQERSWLCEQLRPGTPLLNVARGLRLSGPLDGDALE